MAVFLEAEDLFDNVVRVEINGVTRDAETTPTKRVRIEEQNATPPAKSSSPPETTSPQEVHTNVVCDCCDETIVGFRYKCTECFNFDLCMSCEGKMRHREHMMLRIPSPLQTPNKWHKFVDVEIPIGGGHEKGHHRRHHHGKRHHRRCQRGPAMWDGLFRQLNEDSPVSDPDVEMPTQAREATAAGASATTQANDAQQPQMNEFQKLVKVVEAVAGNVSKLFDPLGMSLDSYAQYGVSVPPTTGNAASPETAPSAPANGTTTNEQSKAATTAVTDGAGNASIEIIDNSIVNKETAEKTPEPTIIDVDETSADAPLIQPTTEAVPMSPYPEASNNSDGGFCFPLLLL